MGKSTRKEIPHGVLKYRNYGCRCDICRAAAAERKRNQRFDKLIPVQPLIDMFGESFMKQYPGSIPRWQREGINVYLADKICCARGRHPIEVFGDIWIDNALLREKKECESGNQSRPVSRTRARTVRR